MGNTNTESEWKVHTKEGLLTDTDTLQKNMQPSQYYEFINSGNPSFLYTPLFKFMRDTEMAKGSEYSATTYMVMSTIFLAVLKVVKGS